MLSGKVFPFLIFLAFSNNLHANPIGKRSLSDHIDKAVDYVRALPSHWHDLIPDDIYQKGVAKMRQLKDKLEHFFEGDLLGINDGRGKQGAVLANNAIEDKSFLWKNGIVPYEISAAFAEHEVEVIQDSLSDIMMKTCIKFVNHTEETDYISFVRRQLGCSSYVARVGGKQLVDLQPGCIYELGEVQHEVMHALGFYHEQSREDRDDYVEIIWDNVKPDQRNQFTKYVSNTLGIPYDYNSIMHYGFNYFAVDITKPTILPKTKASIGNRKVMSPHDVEKINLLYSCAATNTAVKIPAAWAASQQVGAQATEAPSSRSSSPCPVSFSTEVQTTTSSSFGGSLWHSLKTAAKRKAAATICDWLSSSSSNN